MKRGIQVLLFIAFFICPLLAGAEQIPLTIDEAVKIALRYNREVMLKGGDVKKAKLKISEAKGNLFPSLSLTGSWTDTQGYYSKDVTQGSLQATLKQYLYKGGRIINTIKYNGHNFEVAQAILDKAKLDLVFNVRKGFYALLLALEFADLNKGILDNSQEHLAFLKARYQDGQVSESDILKVESSLSSVREAYAASLNQVEAAQALLNNLLYLEVNNRITPRGDFTYEVRDVAFDQAFLKAMQTRPEIRQYEAQAKANQDNIEIAKADNRPNIYASWDYYERSHISGLGTPVKGWNDYSIIGITFSWPIFDGWQAKAKVEQAIVDLKETQLLQWKTANDIALELKNAYLSLKNAIAKLQTQDQEIAVYTDNRESAKKKYAAGELSSLDVNDADLKYAVSRFNQKQATYDYLVAKVNFDKATGGMQ
jgi:outer membrane protein